jgi:Ca2+-binding EF-hand superfamily protein
MMKRRFSAFGVVCAVAVLVACVDWVNPTPNKEFVRISGERHTITRPATIIEQEPTELIVSEDAMSFAGEDKEIVLDAEEGDDSGSDASEVKKATTFFGCLVALVLGTIMFDFVKESIIEYVEESQLAPVVDAMFGELTVLGFIGLVSFVLEKLHAFQWISEQVYSQEIADASGAEKEELTKAVPEIFENLHMTLFLVMVIFIFEVLLTIYFAKMIQDSWMETETVCHEPEQLKAVLNAWHARDHTITEDAAEHMKSAGLVSDNLDFMMDYLALRVEFIDPRESERQHLGNDFDFADYMGHVMGIVLSGIVNVSVYEWLALLGIFTGFYFLFIATQCHLHMLGILMIVFVYTLALMVLALDRKLTWVMKQLTSRPKARNYLSNQLAIMEAAIAKNQAAHTKKTTRKPSIVAAEESEAVKEAAEIDAEIVKEEEVIVEEEEEIVKEEEAVAEPTPEEEAVAQEEVAEEVAEEAVAVAEAEAEAAQKGTADAETPLLAGSVPQLPLYLKQEPLTKRNCVAECFLGQLPNKHEQLFWFDRKGPQYNRMFIQVVLVLMAIYIPIEGTYIYTAATDMDVWFFIIYIVVTIIPILFIFYETMQVLSMQLLVCNVEMMRRRELIQKCKMSQRTKKVVRILQIINRLRQKADVVRAAKEAADEDPEAQKKDEEIDTKRRMELEDIFDYFDADCNGNLDCDELAKFLATLGQPGNVMELAETLIETLDKDKNGTVEKDEFVAWMIKSEQHSMEKENISEIASKMFALFDRDGDGFMTQDEFALKMNQFGIKLSDEELALLMRELDEDGTGRIEEDDFKAMLERHTFEAE